MIKIFNVTFDEFVSMDNLLLAWQEFIPGKRSRYDTQKYSLKLMDNILSLHCDLVNKKYCHGSYHAFNICDPKPRNIHKATVRDRLVHHLIHQQLYPFFSRKFIADSYSCQINKGTHKATNRFRNFFYKVSKNDTKTCWVLKGDIRKFFANIDHVILKDILQTHIVDRDIVWLLNDVIDSFSTDKPNVGLPLGNLTSQLFVNIYLNEFDQFVKHKLKERHYIRYCDDFVILSTNKNKLQNLVPIIRDFLQNRLKLELHPNKLFIKTNFSGVDFLGWKHFTDHRVLRTTTKKRMLKRIRQNPKSDSFKSYMGLLKHGNTEKTRQQVWQEFVLHQED